MADSVNLENLLQLGINAAKRGDRQGARVLLQQVLEADRKNDRAWVWMAAIADNEADRQKYLETALRINPGNKSALKAVQKRVKKRSRSEQRTMVVAGMVILLVLVVAALLVLVVVLTQG